MKPLLLFSLLTVSALADWSDDSIAQLKASDARMDKAIMKMDVRAMLIEDKRFASMLSVARKELNDLPVFSRHAFEQRLDMEAEFHIRQLDLVYKELEYLAENQQAFNRQEDFLSELRWIEMRLRCWR